MSRFSLISPRVGRFAIFDNHNVCLISHPNGNAILFSKDDLNDLKSAISNLNSELSTDDPISRSTLSTHIDLDHLKPDYLIIDIVNACRAENRADLSMVLNLLDSITNERTLGKCLNALLFYRKEPRKAGGYPNTSALYKGLMNSPRILEQIYRLLYPTIHSFLISNADQKVDTRDIRYLHARFVDPNKFEKPYQYYVETYQDIDDCLTADSMKIKTFAAQHRISMFKLIIWLINQAISTPSV